MPRTLIIVVGIVGYMILLIPYWLGFDLHKLAHSPLRDAVTSTTYGRTVFAFMVSTVPLLIDTLLDFFQRFSSKSTNNYVLGRFIYALVTFISSIFFVLITVYPKIYIFTSDTVLSYLLTLYGLRIGTASALMYILASVSPNVCGVGLPLLITLYVVATNITRFYYLAFFDRPFKSSVIMLLFLLVLVIGVYIYWSILLYRKRKAWTLQDYSTIMYMIIYLITYTGSFMTIGNRIKARNLYSDISTSTTIDISVTALSFVVSTVLMIIVPGRIARLEASNNLKTIMDTKKSYVRYISHELRTPMNTVYMGINLCIDDSDCSSGRSNQTISGLDFVSEDRIGDSRHMKMSQKQDILQDTSVACNAAIAILNDLLLYDKVENDMMVLNKTKVPIAELVHDSLKMFNIQYRQKKIELVIENGNTSKDKSTTKLYTNSESSSNSSDQNNDSSKIMNATIDMSTSTALGVHDKSMVNDEDIMELDKAKMIQVIRNVMSNALKFTPDGGQIFVNMRYEEGDMSTSTEDKYSQNLNTNKRCSACPNFKVSPTSVWVLLCRHLCAFVSTVSCGLIPRSFQDRINHENCAINTPGHTGYFVLTIRDTGAGISEVNQSQLFHNIIQFKPEILQHGGGSGLGLYITKSIIDKHRGTINVYSTGEGQGTTFTIKLPMTRQHSTISTSHHNKIQENDVAPVGMKKSPSIIELYQGLYSASQHGIRSTLSYTSNSRKNLSRYDKPLAELTRNITIIPAVTIDTGTPSVSMEPSPEYHDSTCTCTYNDYNESFNTMTHHDTENTRVMKKNNSMNRFPANIHNKSVHFYQHSENDGMGQSIIKESVSISSLTDIRNRLDTIINNDSSSVRKVLVSKNVGSTEYSIKPHRKKHIVNSLMQDDYEVGDISQQFGDNLIIIPDSITAHNHPAIYVMDKDSSFHSGHGLQTESVSLDMRTSVNSPIPFSTLHITHSTPELALTSQKTMTYHRNSGTSQNSVTSSRNSSISESNIKSLNMNIKSKDSSTPRRLHVLIVDDSSMNRKMMARLLSSVHYTYNEAGDGVEAVQIMTQSMKRHPYNRQTSDQVHDIDRQVSDIGASQTSIHQLDEKALAKSFDVILMDFMMPNMDGPTATAEIRKLGYTGPIYGVTGNAQQFDIDHFIEKGADKVFIKPLILADLTKEFKSQFPI